MEGLTLRQVRFANRVAELEVSEGDGEKQSATSIAISVGYSKVSACESASHNLRNPLVQQAIQRRRDELAAAAGITPELILREWAQIALADPNDLVSVVYSCCRDCWALMDEELPPNPECERCKGEGVRYVKVADTRKLKGPARRLYAGAKQTKDGIEIKMRDQDAALAKLADYLGMQNKSTAAVALAATVATAGSIRPEDMTDEQLAAVIAAGAAHLGVPVGVQPAALLPSKTIEASFEPV